MEARLNAQQASPAAYAAMIGLEMFVRKESKLEPSLIELVKMRASQINGCAYCIDMHSKDARSEGETEQRLNALTSWRETPFFSARERAALAWTEALTLITESHVPDDIYELTKQAFSDEELVNLTLAVIAIDGWNRLAISFRSVPGAYQPSHRSRLRLDVPQDYCRTHHFSIRHAETLRMVWGARNRRHSERPGLSQDSQKHCMADYRRTVFRKHCVNNRLFGQNRGWWSVHNLYGCSYSAFARWMGNELVWRKQGGRD